LLERDTQLRELSALARELGRNAAGRVVLIRVKLESARPR